MKYFVYLLCELCNMFLGRAFLNVSTPVSLWWQIKIKGSDDLHLTIIHWEVVGNQAKPKQKYENHKLSTHTRHMWQGTKYREDRGERRTHCRSTMINISRYICLYRKRSCLGQQMVVANTCEVSDPASRLGR
jgi:hypothetical protein